MTALRGLAPVPPHVPESAVYDFDMFLDPALLADPHERIRELLREAPPVFWTPHNGGHWMTIGYAESYAAARDPETFSSQLVPEEARQGMFAALADIGRIPLATPINLDPPAHTRYRAPLNAAFSPKAMLALKDDVRALAAELIDGVIDQGHCDFISAIAEPLPVRVFLKLIGLPVDRMGEFRDLVHEFLAPLESPLDIFLRLRKIADAMRGEIEARQVDPRDDLISLLWATEIDGQSMTYDLMEDYCVLLFIAGLDTVINGIGFGIRHLARNADLQNEIRQDPKLIVEAAEELLRRYTFTIPPRRVARDTVFAGLEMKENEQLILFLPGSGLDPREFPEPEKFDLTRENKLHIAFGIGAHRCLGSHLARIELQVIYEEVLARLPEFRLDPDAPARFHAGNIIAIDSLPLRWD